MREVTVSSLLPFLVNVLTLIAMLGVMLWMNWKLGCIVAVVFPVFFLAVDRLMARIKEVAREQRRREGSWPRRRPRPSGPFARCRRCRCSPDSWISSPSPTVEVFRQETRRSSSLPGSSASSICWPLPPRRWCSGLEFGMCLEANHPGRPIVLPPTCEPASSPSANLQSTWGKLREHSPPETVSSAC